MQLTIVFINSSLLVTQFITLLMPVGLTKPLHASVCKILITVVSECTVCFIRYTSVLLYFVICSRNILLHSSSYAGIMLNTFSDLLC